MDNNGELLWDNVTGIQRFQKKITNLCFGVRTGKNITSHKSFSTIRITMMASYALELQGGTILNIVVQIYI